MVTSDMAKPSFLFVTLLLLVGGNLFLAITDSKEAHLYGHPGGLLRLENDQGDENPDGEIKHNELDQDTTIDKLLATLKKVEDSLEKSGAISIARKVLNVGSVLAPFIPGYGQIFKAGSEFLSKDEKAEALKKGFEDVHETTMGLLKDVKNLDNRVEKDLIYHMFSNLKEDILYFGDLLDMWIKTESDEHKKYLKQIIVQEYGHGHKTGIVHLENLYHNIMTRDTSKTESIMKKVKQTSHCNMNILRHYGKSLLLLMIQGITNHVAYMDFNKDDQEKITDFQAQWAEKFETSSKEINQILEDCSDDALSHIEDDIKDLEHLDKEKDYLKVSDEIVKRLIARSKEYYWLVIVHSAEERRVGIMGQNYMKFTWPNKKIVVVFKMKSKINIKPELDCSALKNTLDTIYFVVEERVKMVSEIADVTTAVVMNRKGNYFKKGFEVESSFNFPEDEICHHKDNAHAGWIV